MKKVTVEIEDVRGKKVELERTDQGVTIRTKALRISPIPVDDLRRGLLELDVINDSQR